MMRTHLFLSSTVILLIALFMNFVGDGLLAKELPTQTQLTLEELNAARNRILSHSVNLNTRIELASSVAGILESKGLSNQARELCLAFFSTISGTIMFEPAKEKRTAIGSPFTEYAQDIEKGKRKSVREKIIGYVEKNKSNTLPKVLSLLALKADDMATAYYVLYDDFANNRLSVYSNYVLGILYARERRLAEAERFLEQAQGHLGDELLERWLTIDLAKLALLTGDGDKAETMVTDLLQSDPNDVRALNLKIKIDLVRDRKDSARQQLARIVPLLYEDPYLLAETASYALQLMELDIAAKILETYKDKVEPNRDFYQALALLRKHQGKLDEEAGYKKKARSVQDSRVVVGGMLAPNDDLINLIEASREKQRQTIESIQGIDHLAKVYLFLLSHDIKNAIETLNDSVKRQEAKPEEYYVLSTLYRRLNQIEQAIEPLKTLRKSFPTFRNYQVLSQLAEYSIRIQKYEEAEAFYQELQKQYPNSYQAQVGKRFQENRKKNIDPFPQIAYKISPFLSRYPQYNPPFVISEIMNHWGDRVSFATINSQLGTSPRRELRCDEFFTILISGTPYQIVPFVGTKDVVRDYLKEKIPVVFCQGEMYTGQGLHNISLLTGWDSTRGQFYAESVIASAPHLLTEPEILEGICIAIYPRSLNILLSDAAKKSAEFGKEYMALNAGAILMDKPDVDFDPQKFNERLKTIAKEKSRGFIPHQIAFARWIIREKTYSQGRQYLDNIRSLCSEISQYWFLDANLEFKNKNVDKAMKSLERTISMNPNVPRYELSRIRVLYMQKKLKEAIAKTEHLRDQFPNDPSVSAHLIALYKKIGDIQKQDAEEQRLKDLLHIENINIDLDSAAQTQTGAK